MSHGKDDREARILRERRASLGLTQDQVATEAGIEMRAYQRYQAVYLPQEQAANEPGIG